MSSWIPDQTMLATPPAQGRPDHVRLPARPPQGVDLDAEIARLVRILRGYRSHLAQDGRDCFKASVLAGALGVCELANPMFWPLGVGTSLSAAGLLAQSMVTTRNATVTGQPPYRVFSLLMHAAYGLDEALVARWADQLVALGVFRRPHWGCFDASVRTIHRIPSVDELRRGLAVAPLVAQRMYCVLTAIHIDLSTLRRGASAFPTNPA